MPNNSNRYDRRVYVESAFDPVSALQEEVISIFDSVSLSEQGNKNVIRVQTELNSVDSFQWLYSQQTKKKFYWKGRKALEAVVGIGCADEIIGNHKSLQSLYNYEDQFYGANESRYFGGVRFDTDRPSSGKWAGFSTFHFILPRFELITTDDSTSLVCNIVFPQDKKRKHQILQEIAELRFPEHELTDSLHLPVSRRDQPAKKLWSERLKGVLNRLSNGASLDKVVLAREVLFEFGEAYNQVFLFKLLHELTKTHFNFYFQLGSETAFMGASPERLFKRDGRYIESEAVAGTGQRAEGVSADSDLVDALIESEKDQREHAFVRDGIWASMKGLCDKMEIDANASVLELNMGASFTI